MPDFRVADTAPEHLKLRTAGLAAIGLWSMAGAYCMNPSQLTDGWVPEYWVATWAHGKRLAATLVKVGLWSKADRNGLAGYQFHDWTDIQRSAEQIAAEKYAGSVRRDLYASPSLVAAAKERDGNRCRYCAVAVSWTNRRGSRGATFDHVIPIGQGGGNDLDNIVVACRGCNSGKGSRTPEQAGMILLSPPSTQLGTSSELDRSQRESKEGAKGELEPTNFPFPFPVPGPSSGSVGGVSPVGRYARDNRNPPQNPTPSRENRPPSRCPKHVDLDSDPGPCRPCGDARQAAETWDASQLRADRERRSSEARQRAEDRARAIADCGLCDAEGYIGTQLCDHDPSAADRARRGSEAVRAALASRPSTVDQEEETA